MRHRDGQPDGGEGSLTTAIGLDRALSAAYRYLNRRDRTEAEMRAHLSRADLDPSDAEQAVATLVEQGYLDDARFVRLFVQDKRTLEEWGSERIRRALLARGAGADLIEEALAEPEAGDGPVDGPTHSAGNGTGNGAADERERALAILRRRFPSLAESAGGSSAGSRGGSAAGNRRERERALGVLLRKGYDVELALDVVAAHLGSSSSIE